MAVGTVKWFSRKKGYGFVTPDAGAKDVFVHITAIQKAGYSELQEGDRLEFELTQLQNGRTVANDLKKIDDQSDSDAEVTETGDI